MTKTPLGIYTNKCFWFSLKKNAQNIKELDIGRFMWRYSL